MYTREQASQLKQEFWTRFGQYLSPKLSSEGEKVNWLNYKTGLKHVYFKMDADKQHAWIAIEITHKDPGVQELFFEQFEEFKTLFNNILKEEWQWELHATDGYGKTISRIIKKIEGVNIFNTEDWPDLISFFKTRIVALDEFWNDVKDGFEGLK